MKSSKLAIIVVSVAGLLVIASLLFVTRVNQDKRSSPRYTTKHPFGESESGVEPFRNNNVEEKRTHDTVPAKNAPLSQFRREMESRVLKPPKDREEKLALIRSLLGESDPERKREAVGKLELHLRVSDPDDVEVIIALKAVLLNERDDDTRAGAYLPLFFNRNDELFEFALDRAKGEMPAIQLMVLRYIEGFLDDGSFSYPSPTPEEWRALVARRRESIRRYLIFALSDETAPSDSYQTSLRIEGFRLAQQIFDKYWGTK